MLLQFRYRPTKKLKAWYLVKVNYINQKALNQQLPKLRGEYLSHKPFPALLTNELLKPDTLQTILECFPDDPEWPGWRRNLESEFIRYVNGCERIWVMPTPLRMLIQELYSPRFLNWLSALTGIDEIIPDPYLEGGGLHMVLPGGHLTPHTDFHIKARAPKYRQLNLILYLNEDWKEENQGFFEFWNSEKTQVVKRVKPELGQAVLFRTSCETMHGYSQPVQHRNRKSIALFYYTFQQSGTHFRGDHVTYWNLDTLGVDPGHGIRRLKQRLYYNLSESASKVSHWASKRAVQNMQKGEPNV